MSALSPSIKAENAAEPAKRGNTWRDLRLPGFILLAIALCLFIYAPVRHFEFLNFDDDLFISTNPWLKGGLSWKSVQWAFSANLVESSRWAEYWEPITLLSRLADAQISGMNAGAFHVTSASLHLLNSLLLAAALWRLTGRWERSALVAILFLAHPFGVEPACWLCARKDLLSATFLFVTLIAYAAYAQKPSRGRYLLALLAYCGALMAKPMGVSIPCVLLVLDWWPLGRWQAARGDRKALASLLAEKAPFLILAAIASLFAVLAQHDIGALQTADSYPLMTRASNAALAYLTYLRRAFWPSDLAGFYPYLGRGFPLWEGVAAALVLFGITVFLFRFRSRAPYLWAGWLWFGLTLGPVIGLVQIGNQGMADRYAYPAAIGLYIGAVWLGASLFRDRIRLGNALAGAAATALTLCSAAQALTWRDSASMFERVIAIFPDCGGAYINLGGAYHAKGELKKARSCYVTATQFLPHNADAWFDLGNVDVDLKRDREARQEYSHALELKPTSATIPLALANVMTRQGDTEAAFQLLENANRITPASLQICFRLATICQQKGERAELDRIWAKYVEIHPSEANEIRALRAEMEKRAADGSRAH